MTRREEAIEKTAKIAQKTYTQTYDARPWEFVAQAAVAAYEAHMRPEVTTRKDLHALPDASVVLEGGGVVMQKQSPGVWSCVSCGEGGLPTEDVSLPARVIHWGDSDA